MNPLISYGRFLIIICKHMKETANRCYMLHNCLPFSALLTTAKNAKKQ